MSEMFTEEDAENDGLIKREVGQQLNGVLSRKSGKLYTKFRQWCEENDRDPANVLGDMVLRSMRDEAFAQELSGTVIDISALERQQIREEDLELVTGLIERFDDADDDNEDPIESLIQQRIKAIGSGPMGSLSEGMKKQKGGGERDLEIQRLEQKIDRMSQQMASANTQDTTETTEQTTEPKEDKKDVDDLFGGGSSSDGDGGGSASGGGGSDDSGESTTVETVDLGHEDTEDSADDVIPTFSSEEAEEQ